MKLGTCMATVLLCAACLSRPAWGAPPDGALTNLTITPRSQPNVGIAAVLLWTDRRGGAHPLGFAQAEVRSTHGQVLAAALADKHGRLSTEIPAPGGEGIFLRVYAAGPGLFVTPPDGPPYHVDSAAYHPRPGNTLNLVITVGHDPAGRPTQSDAHTAFSVFQGVQFAARYVAETARPLPDLAVRFPDRSRGSTAYQRGELHILRQDRWDWDILQHEYGHYAQHQLGITATPGGPHHWWNVSERYGKPKGIPLAWSEGWSTYFPIQLQADYNLAAWQIPGVGDTLYQDTEDQELSVDLGSAAPPYQGEDSEFAIARILWALSSRRLVGDDRHLLNLFTRAHVTSLSEAYKAMMEGQPPSQVAQAGCVFTANGVAPRLTTPAAGSRASMTTPPRFTWEPNGGGPTRRNNHFWVSFYDRAFRLMGTSQPLSRPAFTLSPAQWAEIVGHAGGTVHVVVHGLQTDEPVTGPYAGCDAVLYPTAP